jgi:tetratricopeptide (TPR) repeat protein
MPSALSWYRRIGLGEYFVGAQLKIATLLAQRDGIAAGRRHLRDARAAEFDSTDTNVQLVLAEAQLLRDHKAFQDAFTLLTEAMRATPDVPDLIYDRAMMAEKVNRFEIFEADLKRVIALKPDHAHAHNALGYTLAEQGKRLDEAEQWIEKAVALAPNDAFIQDSLGWVQFRKGQREEALATLRKAYAARPDPEIAAHLGEVMYALGQRTEAHALWGAALLAHPGNEILVGIIEKFKP